MSFCTSIEGICLQQIQGGQQIECIEKEAKRDNRASQPQAPFSQTMEIGNCNLLASLNLLETLLSKRNPTENKIP
jgi:hypothetical protein